MTSAAPPRSAHWKWLVCGLLLFASMLLYMDRQWLKTGGLRMAAC